MNERLRRPASARTLQLGELKISYVPDGAVQLVPRGWFPTTSVADWQRKAGYLDDSGNLVASIGGLLVEYGERALLIDAGFGPRTSSAVAGSPTGTITGGALLDNLARLGRSPADIEAITFSHLHVDHIGWACDPLGLAAFEQARYLVAEPEWTRRDLLEEHGTSAEMIAALTPRVEMVGDREEIFPGVETWSSPGHTFGHTCFVISSGGQRLIVIGDALHSSLQTDHPDWSAASDHDPIRSAQARHDLVKQLEQPGTIGFGGHFADVVFGRVDRSTDGPSWRPLA